MTTRITVALMLSAVTLSNSKSLPQLMISRDSKLTHVCGPGRGNYLEIYGITPEIFDLTRLLLFAKWNIDPEEYPEGVAIANLAWHITTIAAQKP